MSRYPVQQSLKTVVPGSIQSQRTAINVWGVLSGTRTRNVFSEIALNTSEHPLPFYFVSPTALVPTEIAFIDFDGLVRTADFLGAAQHTVQHELSTEFIPFSEGRGTELKLSLEIMSRKDLNYVVREEQNLHKFQVSLLKPSTVPNSG
jgi:hypothetical protein